MATKQDVLNFISAQGHAPSGVEHDILVKYVEATDASNAYAQSVIAAFNAFLAPAPVEAPKAKSKAKAEEPAAE